MDDETGGWKASFRPDVLYYMRYTNRISSARALTISAPPAYLDEVWPLFGSSGPQRNLKLHKIQ
jgi:hypothetical protein